MMLTFFVVVYLKKWQKKNNADGEDEDLLFVKDR